MNSFDIAANREQTKWSLRELFGRVLWSSCTPLYRFSPRLAWGWRCWLLRLFGAKVGKHVHIHPTVKVFIPWNLEIGDWSSIGFDALVYNLGIVRIGERVTISQRSHLCGGSHDYESPTMELIKSTITIEDDAWVCADAFVGPGIVVGNGAVVGARSVVTRSVSPWTVVAGNPAHEIKRRVFRSEYVGKDVG